MLKAIIKYALRTLPRVGLAAALFAAVGLYLLIPAGRAYALLRLEREQPCEITAEAEKGFDLAPLTELEGVSKLTAVLDTTGTLRCGELSVQLNLRGLDSSYLDISGLTGRLFPAQSAMPFIVLNTAAMHSFAGEGGRKAENVDILSDFSLTVADERVAAVCGVIDDGSDEPCGYLSYSTLKALLPPGDVSAERTNLLITLESAGMEPSVTQALRQLGSAVQEDSARIQAWALTERQGRELLLVSGGFLLCSAVLIAQSIRIECLTHGDERRAMTLCGVTPALQRAAILLRIIILLILCAAIAAAAAIVTGQFGNPA